MKLQNLFRYCFRNGINTIQTNKSRNSIVVWKKKNQIIRFNPELKHCLCLLLQDNGELCTYNVEVTICSSTCTEQQHIQQGPDDAV